MTHIANFFAGFAEQEAVIFIWAMIILKILVVIAVTLPLTRHLNAIVARSINANSKWKDNPRTVTLTNIIASIIKVVIYFMAVMIILSLLNINIAPVLASAGVVGIAVAFGAQNMVKDIITGFFVVLDNYFSIGDYIGVGGVKGFVEDFGLRSTKIRDWGGEVHVFPNGEITKVTNYSQGPIGASVDVPIAYSGNLELALSTIKQVCQKMQQDYPNIEDGPTVLGLDSLENDRMLVKVAFKAGLSENGSLGRELRLRMKDALDTQGIEVAPSYTKVLVEQKIHSNA